MINTPAPKCVTNFMSLAGKMRKIKKNKIHSTSRKWEKAMKKNFKKKNRQFQKKLTKGGY